MVPALVGRISFTGEMGYEIYCRPDFQTALFDTLMQAGEPYGIRMFGMRALNSMRLEKGFGSWATEYRPIYGPEAAGMRPFVKVDKGDFIGRDGAKRERDEGPKYRLITLAVEANDADASGDEPIWSGDDVVGWVTSGGYGHTAQQSIALGYVKAEVADTGRTDGFGVEILGDRRPATRLTAPLVDPKGERMRA
jgi:dimethylglycine dehydrogenase